MLGGKAERGGDDPLGQARACMRSISAAAQVDITSGKFVFSASEAYMIEDGAVTAPVKGATLIGNGPDALLKVEMVGNDPGLDPGRWNVRQEWPGRAGRRRSADAEAFELDRGWNSDLSRNRGLCGGLHRPGVCRAVIGSCLCRRACQRRPPRERHARMSGCRRWSLPHLKQALAHNQEVTITALGSSSTAGFHASEHRAHLPGDPAGGAGEGDADRACRRAEPRDRRAGCGRGAGADREGRAGDGADRGDLAGRR